jgi:hypothetical protein
MLESTLSYVFATQWRVLPICLVLLVAVTELGYHFGLKLHHANDGARKGQIAGIQGAILGLLALLLGFTFALAVQRYETRRTLVVEEANAIGTTYLRASFLSNEQGAAVKNLLRMYAEVRIDYYQAGQDETEILAAEDQASVIQAELWSHAVAAAKEAPSPVIATFITSLNELIDLDATRLNALRTHVPGAVWIILLVVAASGCYVSGYHSGASGARSTFSSFVMPVLIALVISLISDIDRPRGGLISIKQQPMFDLQDAISAEAGR